MVSSRGVLRFFAFAVLFTACRTSPPAAPGVHVDRDVLDTWADRDVGKQVPSAVIALVDGNGVRWSHGVGARDARGGAPPDTRTIYRIGSITKVLTGTALLQLRDQGRLHLDDPVGRWIPELAPRLTAADGSAVTLRHLVTHTSGIPGVGDGSAPYWQQTPPTEEQMLRALDVALEFAPGTSTAYSNAGMALAGVVIARASGEPYRTYLQRHVLDPLGMRTAAWDRTAVPAERLAIGVGAGVIDPPHWQIGAFEAAGGLYASVDDMVGLARLALGKQPSVLAPATLREALTDDPLPGPHGVAWAVSTLELGRRVGHTGSTSDYAATLMALPDRGIAAIVLASSGNTEVVECAAFELLKSTVTGKPPGSCMPKPLDAAAAAAIDKALTQLRAFLAAPDDASLKATFAPAFLAAIPRSVIDQATTAIKDKLGRCDRHEVSGVTSAGVAAVLHCERGDLKAVLSAQPEPPHLIDSLLFPEL